MSLRFVITLFGMLGFCLLSGQSSNPSVSIIPEPLECTVTKDIFVWDQVRLEYDDKFASAAQLLTSYLGSSLPAFEDRAQKVIRFTHANTSLSYEAYRLEINPKEIVIKASHKSGALHAVQTLRQLLPACLESDNCSMQRISLPGVVINDKPAFPYRGLHLDVGRHFFSVDFIKKYIDRMALLKLNTFHWHLTEDQGWRIEIKKYPKLNSIGAYRKETLIDHYNTQPQLFDGKRYGGFYTQEEVKEIVAYATARGITVIPEIEMPGHSQAAIASYPSLGCTGNQVEVATKWGIFEDIYCTKDSTFQFLEDVLDEVMDLFPSTYIHIGGDEAPKSNWKSCSNCQKRIQSENMKDEHELQSYFITRIEKYLNKHGRRIIGWDEILEGGLAPNATVMSWRGMNGAIQAAKEGHPVILTPGSHCYFDHYQSDDPNEPLAIGGYTSLEKVYTFDPIPPELTSEEATYVMGGQANVWTEYMPTSEKVEYMVFPRLLAMSNVLWTYTNRSSYDDFVGDVIHFQKRMDAMGIHYANHLHEIKGEVSGLPGNVLFSLSKKSDQGVIRYTTNGTEPTVSDAIYQDPFVFDRDSVILAKAFVDNIPKGNTFRQRLIQHKGIAQNIEWSAAPHPNYNTGGKEALVNGLPGNDKRFGDKEWLGWWDGKELTLTIDFDKPTQVNQLSTRFFNANGQWIYCPREVSILLDGVPFNKMNISHEKELVVDFIMELNHKEVSNVEIKIVPYGIIEEGKQGAGHNGWLFVDELIIK